MDTEVEMHIWGLHSPDGVVKEVYAGRNPSQALGNKKYAIRHYSRRGAVLQWMKHVGLDNVHFAVFETLNTNDRSVLNERKQFYREIYVEGRERVEEVPWKTSTENGPAKATAEKPEPFYTQLPTAHPNRPNKGLKPVKEVVEEPAFNLDEQYATACKLVETLDGRYVSNCLVHGEMAQGTMSVFMALSEARKRLENLKEQIAKRDGTWVSPEDNLRKWQKSLQENEDTVLSEDISYEELADHFNDRRICKEMIKHFTYLTEKAETE